MKVILLKDVRKVGRRFDVKDVADGFAMNSLIPRGFAVAANPASLKQVEEMKKHSESAQKAIDEKIAKELDTLASVTVTLKGKANEHGSLFAAIHKEELAEELRTQSGLELNSDHIMLDKPIKEAGEHMIPVEVAGKKGEFKLVVEALN